MLAFDTITLSIWLLGISLLGLSVAADRARLSRENRRLEWALYLARYDAWELYRAGEDVSDTAGDLLRELQMARGLIRQGRVSSGVERLEYVIDRLRRTQEELEAA